MISNNGVTGTWSPATINTAVAGTTTYTFTPTDASVQQLHRSLFITTPGDTNI